MKEGKKIIHTDVCVTHTYMRMCAINVLTTIVYFHIIPWELKLFCHKNELFKNLIFASIYLVVTHTYMCLPVKCLIQDRLFLENLSFQSQKWAFKILIFLLMLIGFWSTKNRVHILISYRPRRRHEKININIYMNSRSYMTGIIYVYI